MYMNLKELDFSRTLHFIWRKKNPSCINRDILKNPTWSGAKNSNKLCVPSQLVTWIPHCASTEDWIILHHWGVQLILVYSWARPAILVVGKGRGGMFLFLLFLHFHSCSSFFPVPLFHLTPLLSLLSLFSLSLGDDTKWPSRVDVSLNPNTINQFFFFQSNTA